MIYQMSRSWIAGSLMTTIVLCACNRTRTTIKPMEVLSPAQRYVKEFRDFRFAEASEMAPNMSAKIESSSSGSCHTLVLIPNDGPSRFILRAQEADPGSGASFSWGWSKDSKAIFIKGSHSGLDCSSKIQGGLMVIYTLEDSAAWAVPGK